MDTTVAIASLMFSTLFSIVSLLGTEYDKELDKPYKLLFRVLGVGGLLFPAAMALTAVRAELDITERIVLWLLFSFSLVLLWVVRSIAAGKLRKQLAKAVAKRLADKE